MIDSAPPPTLARWTSRIVRYSDEPPEQLLAHPLNWHVHPFYQQQALAGALRTLGFLEPVLVNSFTGRVIDGHLRVLVAMQEELPTVPVAWVELSEAEEEEALLLIDSTTEMGGVNPERHASLLERCRVASPAMAGALATIRERLLPSAGAAEIDHAAAALREELLAAQPPAPVIRQLTFLLPLSDYQDAVALLDAAMEFYAVDSHALALLALADRYATQQEAL